jgi:hypothetical protein
MRAHTLLPNFSSRPRVLANLTKHMSASKRLKLSSMSPSKQSTGSVIVHFYDPDIQAKDPRGRTHEQILAWNNSQLENSHNYIQMLFPLPEGSPFNFAAPVIDLETMKAFRAKNELRQQLRRSFDRMLTFYGFTASNHPEVDNDQKTESKTTKTSDEEQSTTSPKPEANKATKTESSKEGAQGLSPACGEDSAPHDTKASTITETQTQSSPSDYRIVRGPNWRSASRNWCVRFDHNHLRITRILRCLRVLGLQTECDAFFAALKSVYDDPAISISDRTMMYWRRAVERPLYLAPDDEEIEWLQTWEAEQQKE